MGALSIWNYNKSADDTYRGVKHIKVYALSAHAIGSPSRYMPYPLMRLARPLGMCPIHSCDWLALWVYALSTHVIDSPSRYVPHPLMRLARPLGICPIHSCDWLFL